MGRLPPTLRPVNRHLLIVPHIVKEEDESGILLPEDYKPKEDEYIAATVVDVASDCGPHFLNLRRGAFDNRRDIIIDRSMIEEVKYKDKTFFLILENYVVGMLREISDTR
jgi:co-chaperonin GroES (HSP10)